MAEPMSVVAGVTTEEGSAVVVVGDEDPRVEVALAGVRIVEAALFELRRAVRDMSEKEVLVLEAFEVEDAFQLAL